MVEQAVIMAAVAALILLGVVASKASDRLGVPALLLFLLTGMLAGSEGLGRIEFADVGLAQHAGVVALAFILFSGGLDTDWESVRPVLPSGVALATVGVLITALVTGFAATWVFGMSLVGGMLVAAIISSTDAAAVFSVLRSRSVGLKEPLRPLLELESGSNDPMAVFLTLAFLDLLTEPSATLLGFVPTFALQMTVGAAVGYLLARVSVAAINRARLGYEGLYPVLLIAVVLLTYGTAAMLGGSGFLAVYVAGIVMGNVRLLHRRSLMRFADALAWLMQIAMFLVLGLLVFPSDLPPVAGPALLMSVVLIFVARPLAVLPILALARFSLRESLLVSWVGLRGAVPIILATFPLVAGLPQSATIFNVVFFVVLTSVLVQGTTIPAVARWLGVDAPLPRRPYRLEFVESASGSADLHEVAITPTSSAAGRQIVDLKLPPGALVVLVRRGDEFVVPQGSTILEAGDTVLLVADDRALGKSRALIGGEGEVS